MSAQPPRSHNPARLEKAGPRPTNVEVVAGALRSAIAAGRIRPGERLKEIPLAEQLGVSRGPIREAIRLLEHDGLVRVVPNRGAVVPEATAADVLEVYAMRATLGSLALHKLMLDAREAALPSLSRELERLLRATERGRAGEAVEADLRYQSALVAASGLSRVTQEFDRLTWHVRVFIVTLGIGYEDRLEAIRHEVVALHEAISSDDESRAEQLWRAKFERWVRDFLSQMTEDSDTELWAALTAGAVGGQPSPGAFPRAPRGG